MYPMRLSPAFQNYLWGGNRLKTEFHKKWDKDPIAESWELSCHPNGKSVIENGTFAGHTLAEFLEEHPEAAGTYCKRFDRFPVLVKLIDAKEPLSLQVHPADDYAYAFAGEPGKTELWYIADCKKDAFLYFGFQKRVTQKELRESLANGEILNLARKVPVKAGDSFYIEAGTLHGIGAGILIAEIQQNSDQTYRVYDFGRLDAKGNPRPLHLKQAMEVLSLEPPRGNSGGEWQTCIGGKIRFLADSRYFRTAELALDGEYPEYAGWESFVSLLMISGKARIRAGEGDEQIRPGECYFLPAGIGKYTVSGKGTLLIITVPEEHSGAGGKDGSDEIQYRN